MLLSSDQENAIAKIKEFLSGPEKFIILNGSAGTGKTSIINKVFEEDKKQICFSATTNKAVSVMNQMDNSNDNIDYQTIHKLLKVKRRIDLNGEQYFKFKLDISKTVSQKTINYYDIIIIDEASMVNNELFQVLLTVSKKINGKIIFVGDSVQLPPVNEDMSPVFANTLIPQITLTTIHRTQNRILDISNHIREAIQSGSKIKIKQFIDQNVKIFRKKEDWFTEFVKYPNAITLAYTNACCEDINMNLRKLIFGKETISNKYLPGERIVFNNFFESDKNKYYTSQQVTIKEITEQKCPLNSLSIFGKVNDNLMNESNPCEICRCKMNKDITMICEHRLCYICYRSWIQQHKFCPLCHITIGKDSISYLNQPIIEKYLNKIFRYSKKEYLIYNIELENNDVIKVIHIEDLKSYTCDLEKFKMITKELKSNTNIPSIIIKNLWEYYFNSYIDYFADISYGYCITCHKSQGSTYKNVFVDLGNILNMNRKEKEGMKCLYTAITRAAENLIIYY
jgi:uncharacterized protein YjgD (DUF1641 family)